MLKSVLVGNNGKSNKRRRGCKDAPVPPAEEYLRSRGIAWNRDEGCFELSPSKFFESVSNTHSANSTAPRELVNSIGAWVDAQPDVFIKLLLPAKDNDAAGRRSFASDSVIRHLLSIDCMRDVTIHYLLEKLPEFIDEEETGDNTSLGDSVPRLILKTLRWLPSNANGDLLAEKLLEVISCCTDNLKRDVISHLPEILNDREHSLVVEQLKVMMDDEGELRGCILDCFSNLALTGKLLDDAFEFALERVDSCSLEALPIMIRFLVQTAVCLNKADAAEKACSSLRKHLRLGDVMLSQTGMSENEGGGAVIFDTVRSALRFHKGMALAMQKSIRDDDNVQEMDFWLLCVLFELSGFENTSIAVLRKKILEKKYSIGILSAMANYADALRQLFPTLMSISSRFLKASQSDLPSFGCMIYSNAFVYYNDNYVRQEVLGCLLSHIGSGTGVEIVGALDVLLNLTNTHLEELSHFVAFINGVLDYLTRLELSQVRKAYQVFSTLAFKPGASASDSSELLIIVRKQLSHQEFRLKAMGIIGGVSALEAQCKNASSSCDQYKEQLEQMISSCSTSRALAFLFDELCVSVSNKRLNEELRNEISEVVTDILNCKFFPCNEQQFDEDETWFNQDDKFEVCVTIWPKIDSLKHPKEADELVILHPAFRLCVACDLEQDGLENFEPFLQSPLIMPPSHYLEDFDGLKTETKDMVVLALFHAANWLRELLNAFARDSRLHSAVIRIFHNLISTEERLDKCLSVMAEVALPDGAIVKLKQKRGRTSIAQPARLSQFVDKISSHFRPLSHSVLQILDGTPVHGTSIDFQVLCYLATDVQEKLEQLESGRICPLSDEFSTCSFILEHRTAFHYFAKKLRDSIKLLNNDTDALIEEGDDMQYAAPMVSGILQCFKVVLSASSMMDTSNHSQLQDFLLFTFSSGVAETLNALLDETFQFFEELGYGVPEAAAEALVKIFECLSDHRSLRTSSRRPKMKHRLSQFCKRLLQRDWPSLQRRGSFLSHLIKTYVRSSDDPERVLSHMVLKDMAGLISNRVIEGSEGLDTLTRKSFPDYYKISFDELCNQFSVSIKKDESFQTFLIRIQTFMLAFKSLMEFTRAMRDVKIIRRTALRSGKKFVELFLKCLPRIKCNFNIRYQKDILQFLKSLQRGTRTMHVLCAEGKSAGDVGLSAMVPGVKKALERVIYEVRTHLPEQCVEAFSIGTLKHRNLAGDVVPSQFLPEDEMDEDNDEIMLEESEEEHSGKGEAEEPHDWEGSLPRQDLSQSDDELLLSSENEDESPSQSNDEHP